MRYWVVSLWQEPAFRAQIELSQSLASPVQASLRRWTQKYEKTQVFGSPALAGLHSELRLTTDTHTKPYAFMCTFYFFLSLLVKLQLNQDLRDRPWPWHTYFLSFFLFNSNWTNHFSIQNDVKLAQLVRAQECPSQGHWFASCKNLKTRENSNLQGFELHRPLSKSTKLLLQVIKAIINLGFQQTIPNCCPPTSSAGPALVKTGFNVCGLACNNWQCKRANLPNFHFLSLPTFFLLSWVRRLLLLLSLY